MSSSDLFLICLLMFALYFRFFAESAIKVGFEVVKGTFHVVFALLGAGLRGLHRAGTRLGLFDVPYVEEGDAHGARQTARNQQRAPKSVTGRHRSSTWVYHENNSLD